MRYKTLRVARSVLASILVIWVIQLLRETGFIRGIVSVLMIGLLVIIVPFSRNASRRVLFAGAIILGWLPVTYWFDLGPGVDRAGWLLAVGYGLLTAWIVGSDSPRIRIRRLVPRFHVVDLIPVGTGVAAVWLYWPFLASSGGSRTLNVLMKSGWDHVAHFNMVELIARSGSMFGSLAASPDGSSWDNSRYPKQMHILINFVDQLTTPSSSLRVDPGIDGYGQGLAVVLIAMAVVLASGLAQLPSLVRRPAWALPLIALPLGAFLFGPGAVALTTGYPNYVLAVATVGLTACVAVTMAKIFLPLQALAVSGLLVATAHGWILLLPISAVAALVALMPFRRGRWRASTPRIWTTVAILSLGAAGIGVAVWLLLPELRGETLLLGASEPFPAGMILGSAFSVIAIGTLGIRLNFGMGRSEYGLRAASVGAVSLVGVVLVVGIGLMQFRTSGALLYYFGKLASGVMLISLFVLAIVVSAVIKSSTTSFGVKSRVVSLSASILLAVAALQPFGYVGPRFGGLIAEEAAGLRYRSDSLILTAGESDEASRLLSAAKLAKTRPFGRTLYLAPLPGDPLPHLANQWHLALAGTWSDRADSFSKYLDSDSIAGAIRSQNLAPEVQRILDAEPTIEIIVAPSVYGEVRPNLTPALRDRLITWP